MNTDLNNALELLDRALEAYDIPNSSYLIDATFEDEVKDFVANVTGMSIGMRKAVKDINKHIEQGGDIDDVILGYISDKYNVSKDALRDIVNKKCD